MGLGACYYFESQYVEAESLFRQALEVREKALGPEHPDVAECLHNLASLYTTEREFARAEPLFKRALKIRKERLGAGHPVVRRTMQAYAVLLRQTAREEEAGELEAVMETVNANR